MKKDELKKEIKELKAQICTLTNALSSIRSSRKSKLRPGQPSCKICRHYCPNAKCDFCVDFEADPVKVSLYV